MSSNLISPVFIFMIYQQCTCIHGSDNKQRDLFKIHSRIQRVSSVGGGGGGWGWGGRCGGVCLCVCVCVCVRVCVCGGGGWEYKL